VGYNGYSGEHNYPADQSLGFYTSTGGGQLNGSHAAEGAQAAGGALEIWLGKWEAYSECMYNHEQQ
jgi:hypothetical protein